MTPPRFCRCPAPRPIRDATGLLACDECGETVDEGMARRDRILTAVARELVALRRRVAQLEAERANGKRSNGRSNVDQLSLIERAPR